MTMIAPSSNLSMGVPYAIAQGPAGTAPAGVPPLDRLGWEITQMPGPAYLEAALPWSVRLWWRADARRRLSVYEITAPDALGALAEALAGCLWVPWAGRRARPGVAARVRRFLASDPLTGVTVTYNAPLLTITLAPGARWTPARVKAADLECRILGAGLTLTYRPGWRDTPSDVALVVHGSSVREWWGDATVRTFLCLFVRRP